MDLNNLRSQIDRVDSELVELFQKRMELCKAVAEYKKEHDLPIFSPNREEIVLSRVENMANKDLAPYTRELYEKILELSKQYQELIIDEEVR